MPARAFAPSQKIRGPRRKARRECRNFYTHQPQVLHAGGQKTGERAVMIGTRRKIFFPLCNGYTPDDQAIRDEAKRDGGDDEDE